MRSLLAVVAATLAVGGGTLACGALTGVDWDRVAVKDGTSSGASGTSSGASGTSGGASGASGGDPAGMCTDGQVECLDASGVVCCPAAEEDQGKPVTIAAGGFNTCTIMAKGQISCWGSNSGGQLGRTTPTFVPSSNRPLPVFRIPKGAKQASIGNGHMCAIVDSLLTCWGNNRVGQLGIASMQDSPLPVVVALPAAPDAIGLGDTTTCASAGGVGYCWGDNTTLQAGSDSEKVFAPKPVKNLVPLVAGAAGTIKAGRQFSCAAAADNHFYCWGTNSFNRLGSAAATQTAGAIKVFDSNAAGSNLSLGEYHACVQITGGGVQCWGGNTFGELGNDEAGPLSTAVITPVGLGAGVTSLCTGANHTCVVIGGAVKCFGSNNQGQCGTTGEAIHTPTAVQSMTGFTAKQVACGTYHTCALSTEGAVRCWGSNMQGERGDGTTDGASPVPREVTW